MKGLTLVLSILLLFASAAAAAAADEQEVRAQMVAAQQKWTRAWNDRDLEAILALYTADAVSYSPDSGIVKGRAAMRARFQAAFKEGNHSPETATTADVFHQGDYATETGAWISKAPDGSTTDEGAYMTLWHRQNGGAWKIVREIYNSTRRKINLGEALREAD